MIFKLMKKFKCNYLKLFRKSKTKDVQNAYDEFHLLVKSEVENKLSTYESSRRDRQVLQAASPSE